MKWPDLRWVQGTRCLLDVAWKLWLQAGDWPRSTLRVPLQTQRMAGHLRLARAPWGEDALVSMVTT